MILQRGRCLGILPWCCLSAQRLLAHQLPLAMIISRCLVVIPRGRWARVLQLCHCQYPYRQVSLWCPQAWVLHSGRLRTRMAKARLEIGYTRGGQLLQVVLPLDGALLLAEGHLDAAVVVEMPEVLQLPPVQAWCFIGFQPWRPLVLSLWPRSKLDRQGIAPQTRPHAALPQKRTASIHKQGCGSNSGSSSSSTCTTLNGSKTQAPRTCRF